MFYIYSFINLLFFQENYINNLYNIRFTPNNTQQKITKSRLLTEIQNHNNTHCNNDPESKEIISNIPLCKNYIENELKEIKILKDQIVNNKIEQYRWRKEKSINTESNKPFLQAKMKKDKKQLQYTSLKKENLKTYGIILKILQRIINFFTEIIKNIPEVELAIGKHSISNSYIDIINNIPELELSLGKYLDDKLRKIHNKFSKKKKK